MTQGLRRSVRLTHRTLVLSWHPEDGYITAGGYRRSREIVRRLAQKSELVVIDTAPSIYGDLRQDGLSVVEYSLPALRFAASYDRRTARAVQWSIASAKLVWHGLRELRRRPYDTIYVPTSELLVCSLAAVVLRKLTHRRLVMCNLNTQGIFARRLTLALHNSADAVTVLSEALAGELTRAGVDSRIEVTGMGGPHFDDDVPPDQPLEKRWDGIFIGRHTTEKGVFDLLEIWRFVRERRPDATLLLVGACSAEVERAIREQIARMSAESDVVLAGVVSDREKFALLRAARVLVAPSRVEGWGLVPLEALGVGVPAVCWDLPAYRESLPDTDRVIRIAIGDVAAFAEGVLDALEQQSSERTPFSIGPQPHAPWQEVAEREWAIVSRG